MEKSKTNRDACQVSTPQVKIRKKRSNPYDKIMPCGLNLKQQECVLQAFNHYKFQKKKNPEFELSNTEFIEVFKQMMVEHF